MFNGDKRNYENRKLAFNSSVDQALVTPEFKLLQLRKFLSYEALKAIENRGSNEQFEQEYGGQRRKVMLHMGELI